MELTDESNSVFMVSRVMYLYLYIYVVLCVLHGYVSIAWF